MASPFSSLTKSSLYVAQFVVVVVSFNQGLRLCINCF